MFPHSRRLEKTDGIAFAVFGRFGRCEAARVRDLVLDGGDMGGITSGVGIFSGINTAQLIDQLLALEARPKQLAQQRIVSLQQQRAAYLDVNSSILAFKTAAQKFRTSSTFKTSKADSSNKDVLTATAGNDAVAGTYQFVVKRLVTNQQSLSRSFTDATVSGVGATSFTFELGGGRIASETRLSELNGGNGIERGKITIGDAAGGTATVDLSTAVTVGDVLDTINAASGVRVKATVDGDKIKITDANASGAGALTISNATGYNTATSLGIAKTATAGFGNAVTGDAIRTLSGATALATLNDGTGVTIRDASDDLTITARDGSVHNIKLGQQTATTGTPPDTTTTITQTRATSLQDVISYINTQTGGKVTAALNAQKTGLVLTDTTGATASNLIVRSATADRTTAKDLGIETSATGVAAATVSGKRLISGLNSVLVSSLNGGAGFTDATLSITDRLGTATAVTIGAGALAGSLDDVVNDINSQLSTAGNGVRVKSNRAGNGLALADDLSNGTGNIAASGAAATALGIAASGATGGSFNGGNLQSRWISQATTLASLNGGNGVGTGSIRITDSSGGVATLTIGDSIKTVDDLAQFVNAAAGIDVTLSVNTKGDGLIVRDTSGGTGKLKIEDASGIVAKNLNLVGEDDNDGGVFEIDGSFERTVTLAATDNLNSVTSKINAANTGVSAAVIRDGSGYRLSLTSQRSGSVGRATIDTGSFDLGLTALSKGDDSVAFFGAGDPARGILLTSSTNSLVNVVQGVTIDLKQTSDAAVSLVVSRDTEATEKAVNDFVTAYNVVSDKLKRYDSYDVEAKKATALFGDQTIGSLRSGMRRILQGTPDGVQGSFSRLFQIGIKFTDGSKLEFDSAKFREALAQDPASVEALLSARDAVARSTQVPVFDDGDGNPANDILVNNTSNTNTFKSLGIAEKLAEFASSTTSSVDGMLTRRGRTLDEQIRSQQSRIGSFDQRLEQKRLRLERQFADMEQAIASLQSQSSALGSIQSIR